VVAVVVVAVVLMNPRVDGGVQGVPHSCHASCVENRRLLGVAGDAWVGAGTPQTVPPFGQDQHRKT